MTYSMTLIERLRNPAWALPLDPSAESALQIERTTADMREAADHIERLCTALRTIADRDPDKPLQHIQWAVAVATEALDSVSPCG